MRYKNILRGTCEWSGVADMSKKASGQNERKEIIFTTILVG